LVSNDLPPPLVEPRVDCTDLDGFMLNTERLMSSELPALYGNEIIGAALMLWCRAWKQRPAASLPDDDKVNSAFARLPLARFRKLKDAVMHGFVKCSDGRLYHPVLAAEAAKAYEKKISFQKRRAADAQRIRNWRERKPHQHRDGTGLLSEGDAETPNETRFNTRVVADGNGKDRDRYLESPLSVGSKSPKRGTRLAAEWRPNERDWIDASNLLGSRQAENELAKFRDYWPAQPGKNAVKLDWDATWRNWVRRAAERLPISSQGAASAFAASEPAVDMGGEFREVAIRNLSRIVQMFLDNGSWPFLRLNRERLDAACRLTSFRQSFGPKIRGQRHDEFPRGPGHGGAGSGLRRKHQVQIEAKRLKSFSATHHSGFLS
jgi:uncharacterized protein YdaU (DUF1376 family)